MRFTAKYSHFNGQKESQSLIIQIRYLCLQPRKGQHWKD